MLLVLFPDGDSITRSNEVETTYRRVNPDDWDGDGIHNERDANPTSCDGDFFGAASSPINVCPSIIACFGGCCSRQVVDVMLQWSCSLTCTCGGGYHSFETTALWEGYSKLFVGYASCGCWEDAPDPVPTPSDGPYAASVSACFSKDAVIFEDGYENSPGEWVSRRSTATMLTISASGGTNGAVLSVSATNLGKLQKNSGPAFPAQSVSVPAMQSITYAMNYVGLSASGTADDIEVVATLTENGTGAISTSAATTTAVRVELEARYAAPANTNLHRHVFGVLEDFYYRQYPNDASVAWHFTEGDEDMIPVSLGRIILHATTNQTSGGHCEFRVMYGDVAYTNAFLMVLPRIEARNPRCNENLSMVQGEAGWLLLHLDIYVGPSYVSFHGVDFQEIPDESGNCPHEGYYNSIAMGGYLSHCELAGAGEWHRLVATNGYLCSDKVGRGGRYEQPWSDGWKEWTIPIGWGIDENLRAQFDAPPTTQKFTLTSDGTFTVRKFHFEATRDTSNHITTRRIGNE